MAWTKEERAEYNKNYREKHREQINANRRYYYKRNKEAFTEYHAIWREKHREHYNAYHREYYKNHNCIDFVSV